MTVTSEHDAQTIKEPARPVLGETGAPEVAEEVAEALRAAGLKVTRPRLALLGALKIHHGPFTMEELHRQVDKSSCDLVTVYRCLSAFEAAGLVKRCDFGDGAVRFELSGGRHHHHHVICRRCRKVKNLDACFVQEIESRLQGEGYSEITHSLEFFGVCAECSGAVAEAPPRLHS